MPREACPTFHSETWWCIPSGRKVQRLAITWKPGYGLRVTVGVSVIVGDGPGVGVRVGVSVGVGLGPGVIVGVAVGGMGRNDNCQEAEIGCAGSDDGQGSVLRPVTIGTADCATATA